MGSIPYRDPASNKAFQPGEILVDIGCVDDQFIPVGGEAIDQDIVDHGAVVVAEGRILGIHVVQLVDIVHGGALEEAPGALPRNKEVSHVGNIEKADGLANGLVFLADARILHRHDEPGEGNHLGVQSDMKVV